MKQWLANWLEQRAKEEIQKYKILLIKDIVQLLRYLFDKLDDVILYDNWKYLKENYEKDVKNNNEKKDTKPEGVSLELWEYLMETYGDYRIKDEEDKTIKGLEIKGGAKSKKNNWWSAKNNDNEESLTEESRRLAKGILKGFVAPVLIGWVIRKWAEGDFDLKPYRNKKRGEKSSLKTMYAKIPFTQKRATKIGQIKSFGVTITRQINEHRLVVITLILMVVYRNEIAALIQREKKSFNYWYTLVLMIMENGSRYTYHRTTGWENVQNKTFSNSTT